LSFRIVHIPHTAATPTQIETLARTRVRKLDMRCGKSKAAESPSVSRQAKPTAELVQ
jgi:hypothetical protein